MKKLNILLCCCVFLSCASTGFAYGEYEQEFYEQAFRDEVVHVNSEQLGQSNQANQARPLPNYFSQTYVPLTSNEQDILKMAKDWASKPSKPIRLSSGKIAFLHGASVPTIIASPFNISDIEFDAGEQIQSVLLGDTARWQVESGFVGTTPHIFLKPLDTGLETSAVITSDKRVYHLRLVSQSKGFMPYVGFIYQEKNMAIVQNQQQRNQQESYFQSTVINGQSVNLTNFDFNYRILGSARWKPVQVYNDGNKTYVRLPEKVQEMPILLARSKGDVLVNYRIENNTFIVDGTFQELVLVLGVGSGQEKITIEKRQS